MSRSDQIRLITPWGHTVRKILMLIVAGTISLTACSDDDQPNDGPGTTGPAPSSEAVPAPSGSVTLTLGETTYEAQSADCNIDDDSGAVAFTATGTHNDQPIRIEFGPATGGNVGLFINPSGPIDVGDKSFIGPATFETEGNEATAEAFQMASGGKDPLDASLVISCG